MWVFAQIFPACARGTPARVDRTEAWSITLVRGLSFGFSLHAGRAVRAPIISGTNDPVLSCMLQKVCVLASVSHFLYAMPAPILVIHLQCLCIFLQLPSVATNMPWHSAYFASWLPCQKASQPVEALSLWGPRSGQCLFPHSIVLSFPLLSLGGTISWCYMGWGVGWEQSLLSMMCFSARQPFLSWCRRACLPPCPWGESALPFGCIYSG